MPPSLRYAVLWHDGIERPHYDVLVESAPGGPLIAFRAPAWPPAEAGATWTRLPDHRRLYLDYEGPVSNDRGTVRRVAAGTCELDRPAAGPWALRLADLPPLLLTAPPTADSDRWTVQWSRT